jgi:hypothetical protein
MYLLIYSCEDVTEYKLQVYEAESWRSVTYIFDTFIWFVLIWFRSEEDFFYLHSGGWKQGPLDTAAT